MNTLIKTCKKELFDIYQHALEAVKPEKLIRRCVSFSGGNLIVRVSSSDAEAKPILYDLSASRVHVIGGGKCVLGMAKGLAQLVRESGNTHMFSHGCLSLPNNQKSEFDSATDNLLSSLNITCRFGAKNNLPDEESVEATKNIFDCVEEASRLDKDEGLTSLFIVLLSGGGSACLTLPRGRTLKEKLTTIRELVWKGADIKELNAIRQSMSGVKGGRLASHILKSNPGSNILALIISDVVGDPLETIASGPTCITQPSQMELSEIDRIRHKYDCSVDCSDVAHGSKNFNLNSISNVIVGNNSLAMNSAAGRAKQLGYAVKTSHVSRESGTRAIVDVLDKSSRRSQLAVSKCLSICGGEATIIKGEDESWGVGGRAQELAMQYLVDMRDIHAQMSRKNKQENVPGIFTDVFFAGTTDGQDGPTDVGGCFASVAEFVETTPFDMQDVHRALAKHDSNTFWSSHKPDWLVKTGPTGTNVMDLYMLARVYER